MDELYDFFYDVGATLKEQGRNISAQILIINEEIKSNQHHNAVNKLIRFALEAKKQFPEKMLDCLSDDEKVRTGALQNSIIGLNNGNVS